RLLLERVLQRRHLHEVRARSSDEMNPGQRHRQGSKAGDLGADIDISRRAETRLASLLGRDVGRWIRANDVAAGLEARTDDPARIAGSAVAVGPYVVRAGARIAVEIERRDICRARRTD